MSTFKTKGGTDLPLIALKGKAYLQVAHRLVWFREEHPDWSIESEIVLTNDKYTICKATIRDTAGRVIATAHKREDGSHFSDHMEKSETSAIGRALGLCGYGTQFAEDFDEEGRLADAPTTPRSLPNPTTQLREPVKLISESSGTHPAKIPQGSFQDFPLAEGPFPPSPKTGESFCDCGKKMMVSKYRPNELYCTGCKATRPVA